jgi:hypothetical protein
VFLLAEKNANLKMLLNLRLWNYVSVYSHKHSSDYVSKAFEERDKVFFQIGLQEISSTSLSLIDCPIKNASDNNML